MSEEEKINMSKGVNQDSPIDEKCHSEDDCNTKESNLSNNLTEDGKIVNNEDGIERKTSLLNMFKEGEDETEDSDKVDNEESILRTNIPLIMVEGEWKEDNNEVNNEDGIERKNSSMNMFKEGEDNIENSDNIDNEDEIEINDTSLIMVMEGGEWKEVSSNANNEDGIERKNSSLNMVMEEGENSQRNANSQLENDPPRKNSLIDMIKGRRGSAQEKRNSYLQIPGKEDGLPRNNSLLDIIKMRRGSTQEKRNSYLLEKRNSQLQEKEKRNSYLQVPGDNDKEGGLPRKNSLLDMMKGRRDSIMEYVNRKAKKEVKIEIARDSDGSNSSSEDDEPRWDDTICSNRSQYFKLYYGLQRGVGDKADGKGQPNSRFSTQNSLTSLIREKMGQNAPPPTPPARTKADIGLMVLVAVLFIIIVVGISLIYYFYHQHLLELKIFNRLKFQEDGRILHIYDDNWKPQTTAYLGTTLDPHMLPEDCTHYLHYMHEHNKTIKSPKPEGGGSYKEFVCLDWTYQARLQLRKLYDFEDVHCYLVWWVGNHDHLTLRDCVHMGGEDGTWWGGGEMTEGGYPLNKANIPPTPMVTGELGRHAWGKLLRRSWMSSTASLLTLPDYSHAKVSINHNNDGEICMESTVNPMAIDRTPKLEYTLCRASNISSLYKYLYKEAKEKVRKLTKSKSKVLDEHKIVTKSDGTDNKTKAALNENTHLINDNDKEIVDKVKASLDEAIEQDVLERVVNRMEHPVWIPWLSADQPELTQTTVLNYVDNIVEKDYGMWGHILLPPTWQAKPGTLEFDPSRFSNPKNMSESLENLGFKLALSIHPFVSVTIQAFDDGTEEGYWIKQKGEMLPALSQYENRYPAALTDFTNPRASHWYSSRLKRLQKNYKVERFHLQQPTSYNFPIFHDYHEPLSGPDRSIAHFVNAVSVVSAPLSSDGSIGTPPAPTFMTVGEYGEGWRGLETLIARVLSLGSTGSPFVDVGVIGGLAKPGHIPDRELYIRWIQTAAFMPAFQINTLPHVYDKDVENLAKEFTKKRQELVLPRLREDLPNALKYGFPLAKPLIYHFPNDKESGQISDQWMIGNDLLVAPVIQKGVRVRDIYLPPGIWKDLLDGRMRRGGRYIKEYKVPLTQLPHFEQIRPEDLD